MTADPKKPVSADRRHFLKSAILAAAGVPAVTSEISASPATPKNPFSADPVALRKLTDNVSATRLGFGTGMISGTELRNLGEEKGIDLLRYAYDQGIRLFDMADTYKTHSLVGKALQGKDREEYTLNSKIWIHDEINKPLDEQVSARDLVTRFLKEIGTDYLDVLQIHCLMKLGWENDYARYMDELDELKDEGLIRSHGVSCHSLEASRVAASHPWVDTIHIRFNPFGARMDGTVEENLEVIETAHKNGKGTIIMKVAGEGSFDNPQKIADSIQYVTKLDSADVMVVGMASNEHVDFLISNAAKALQEIQNA